mgnify:CR=1 FL=1
MEQQQNIIITDSLSGIGTEAFKGYLGHALCLDGSCRIMFNGKEFEMKRGDLMIVRQGRLVQSVKADSHFRVTMIYIAVPFIEIWHERPVGFVSQSHHAPHGGAV